MIGLSLFGLCFVLVAASAVYTQIRIRQVEKQFPPLGEFMDVGGVRMHYVDLPADDPDAPTIVFIHGASGNLRDPLIAFRAGLIGRFRLIFVDRPGHGYSTRGTGDMAAPLRQAEVIHGLVSHLGITREVVVGHSLGAAVAAAYAVAFKADTAALMLIAPATHPWPGGVDWYYNVATSPIIGPIFTHTLVFPIGERMMPEAMRSVFGHTPIPPAYTSGAGTPLVLRPAEFAANAEDVRNLNANAARMAPRYHEITAPTVIVTGGEDGVVRNDIHAAALMRDIAGARLVNIPDAGHAPQFSDPELVIATLRELASETQTHGFASLPQPAAVARADM